MRIFNALIFIVLLAACSNDDAQTTAQINAAKVSQQLSLYKVDRVVVYEKYNTSYALRYDGNEFKIDGQFFVIEKFEYWNFENLVSFESGSRTMALYFR